MKNLLVVGLLVFLLGGCSVGPKYNKPEFHPPANYYTEEQSSSNSAADLAWWELFKDPVLQSLIRESFANNYDLRSSGIARGTGTCLAWCH